MAGRVRSWKTVILLAATVLAVAAIASTAFIYLRKTPLPAIPHPDPKSFVDREVQQDVANAAHRVESEPNSAEAWGEYGLILRAYRQHPEADVCFQAASELDPKDGRWPFFIGSQRVETDPPSAVEWLQRAKNRTVPSNAQEAVLVKLSEALIAAGRPHEVAAVLGSDPKTARTRLTAARAAAASGDDQVAAGYLADLMDHPIAARQAILLQAEICRRQGRISYADYLSSRGESTPPLPWPDPLLDPIRSKDHSLGGRLDEAARLLRDGRPDQAELVLKPLLNNPAMKDPRPFVGMAEARGAMGDRKGAMMALEAAIKLDPKNLAANYQTGLFHFDAGEKLWVSGKAEQARAEFRDAVVWLDKALAISPDFGKALLLKGTALHRFLGQPDEGLAILRRFVLLRPEAGEGHLLLGQALAESGQVTAATASLRRALELAPNGDRRAADALAKLTKPEKR